VRVIDETLLDAMEKMDKAVVHVQSQFATVRTGRAAPALVEHLLVEYYGAPVPMQQLVSIQVPEARQLLIKPHDRAALGAVEKDSEISADELERAEKELDRSTSEHVDRIDAALGRKETELLEV
jgi:ribosome recycling factor